MIAKHFTDHVVKTETRSSIAPDHKAIFLSLKIDNAFRRGPGNWKFNNCLLEDEEYLELIKGCLPFIEEKYKDVESDQLLWELTKMEIRSKTIDYSKRKRKRLRDRAEIVQQKIQEIDGKICNEGCLDDVILMEYDRLKSELNDLYTIRGKEAMFRSKVRWIEDGEKPTKYFLNTEKRNYERKV